MSEIAAAPAAEIASGRSSGGKLSIVMFSGTADKFIPLGVLRRPQRRWAWRFRCS